MPHGERRIACAAGGGGGEGRVGIHYGVGSIGDRSDGTARAQRTRLSTICTPCKVARMPKLRLVPQTREFYTLFDQAAANLVATAHQLLDLMEHYPDRKELVAEIKELEHEGDRITHEIVQLLHKTFVTPIDREDIYDLTTALDDIQDFMDQVADELNLYGVEEVPREAIDQAGVILRAVSKLAEAVSALNGLRDIGALLVDIHTLEDDGDQLVRRATANLFSGGMDPLVVIRWKDIHADLEQAIDSCERAAHVLESVYLKNR
jgi:predicted phosphate transport protein (TIGR00153 family)